MERSYDGVNDDDSYYSEYANPKYHATNKQENAKSNGRWTVDEDDKLNAAIHLFGEKNWKIISDFVRTKTNLQCRQRWLKCTRPGIKKGKWSKLEDDLLESIMRNKFYGWKYVAEKIPGRTSKQCRDRWNNYISPTVDKSPFTPEDNSLVKSLYYIYGNQWAKIAQHMPGRTENQVRSRVEQLRLQRRAFTLTVPRPTVDEYSASDDDNSMANSPHTSEALSSSSTSSVKRDPNEHLYRDIASLTATLKHPITMSLLEYFPGSEEFPQNADVNYDFESIDQDEMVSFSALSQRPLMFALNCVSND